MSHNVSNKIWCTDLYSPTNVCTTGNVSEISMNHKLLWTPDIVLYNNVDSDDEGNSKYGTRITASYNGEHTWLAPTTFSTRCNIDVAAFPYDTQHCYLRWVVKSSFVRVIGARRVFGKMA